MSMSKQFVTITIVLLLLISFPFPSYAEYFTVVKQNGRRVIIDGNIGSLKVGQKLYLEGSSISVKVIKIQDELATIEVPPTGAQFQPRERISIINPRNKKQRTENQLNGSDLTLSEPLEMGGHKHEVFIPRKNLSALNYFTHKSEVAASFEPSITSVKTLTTNNQTKQKLVSTISTTGTTDIQLSFGLSKTWQFMLTENFLIQSKVQSRNEQTNKEQAQLTSRGPGNLEIASKFRVVNKNDNQLTNDIVFSLKPKIIKYKAPAEANGVLRTGNNGDVAHSFSLVDQFGVQSGVHDFLFEFGFNYDFAGYVETGDRATSYETDAYNLFILTGSWRMHFEELYIGPQFRISFPVDYAYRFKDALSPYTQTVSQEYTFSPGFSLGYDFTKNFTGFFSFLYTKYDLNSKLSIGNSTTDLSSNVSQSIVSMNFKVSL